MGCCWYDSVLNRRLLRETDLRPITCIVCERQLWLYGHVACYPEVDPAHQVVSVWDNPVWRWPRERPQLSWLEQVDESCQELLRMGRGPAWRLARRNPQVWRHRLGDATRPLVYAPFDWLIDWLIINYGVLYYRSSITEVLHVMFWYYSRDTVCTCLFDVLQRCRGIFFPSNHTIILIQGVAYNAPKPDMQGPSNRTSIM